jgi:flagellar motor switch protein FliN/FliY
MDATHEETNEDPAAVPVATAASSQPDPMALLRDVEVELTLEIGRKRMRIADVVKLGPGRTVELDKLAGEPLELLVNGRIIGRGEAVVVGDRYGIRITEIVTPEGTPR